MAKMYMLIRDDEGEITDSKEYELPILDLRFFLFLFHETMRHAIEKRGKEG